MEDKNKEESTKEHFREGKKHLEKGTQKVMQAGIEKGREQTKKLDYYRQNRSEFIENVSRRMGNPKKPAVSGLIVVLPVAVVLLLVNWLFNKIGQIPGNQYFNISNIYYLNQTFKLAILLTVAAVVVTGVGRLVRTERGFQLEKILDEMFDMIPFIGSVYNMTKVTTETVMGGAEDFSRPVKVEHSGFRLTGFKTGNQTKDGREIVFMPTAPNITSGLVLELDEEKIEDADETAEEALTRILSAGFGEGGNSSSEEE
ncbi:DUF502 domain-containing protein [Candidatus Nanohaloarchaea archaeon]|nr:DUF502 domain-containing protein [Candidatus Nanohaloarchaea archaeon]